MDYIIKQKVFDVIRCWMYSIELQKRGLPHAHILFWMFDKIRPDHMDSIISAQIPDPETDPELYSVFDNEHDPWFLRSPKPIIVVHGKRKLHKAFSPSVGS